MKRSKYEEIYIDNQDQLEEFCRSLHGITRIMLDTEFISERTYYPRLALIQAASDDAIALIDPIAVPDLSPFGKILFDEKVEKVIHSGRIDLAIFRHMGGKVPSPIFDTQVAASLLGFGNSISYENLVRDLLDVHLKSTATYTDWLRRPLSAEQIKYAKDDVRYLGDVADRLGKRLRDRSREVWADEEFEKLIALVEREASDEYSSNGRSIKGASHLTPEERNILNEVYIWREERARKIDIPRMRVMRDDLMVEISRRKPLSADEIAEIRGMSRNEIEKFGAALVRAVKKGMKSRGNSRQGKHVRSRPRTSDTPLISLLTALLNMRAEQAKVASAVIANRDEIQMLVESYPDFENISLPILGGWRRKLVGDDFIEILSGKARLGVNSKGDMEIFR